MANLRKNSLIKLCGWFCILPLILCACSAVPDHCGDYVSIAAGVYIEHPASPTFSLEEHAKYLKEVRKL